MTSRRRRGWEPGCTHVGPPRPHGVDRELGSVGAVADRDPALVVGQVVDAIRHRSAKLFIFEVVDVHFGWLALWAPFAPTVGELSHQLFLFRVDADSWLPIG